MFSDEYVLKYYHDWFYWKDLEEASGRLYKDLSDLLIRNGKDEVDEDGFEHVFYNKNKKTTEQLARDCDVTLRAVRRAKRRSSKLNKIKTHFGVFQKQEKSTRTPGPYPARTSTSVKKNLDNGSTI